MTQTVLMAKSDHQVMFNFIGHELGDLKKPNITQSAKLRLSGQPQCPSASPSCGLSLALSSRTRIDADSGDAGVPKPARTRKFHKKTRTGCLTCKIRRKKCDETKPACNRCTTTGRTCDGYASSSQSTGNSDPPANINENSSGGTGSFSVLKLPKPPLPGVVESSIDTLDSDHEFDAEVLRSDASYTPNDTEDSAHRSHCTPLSPATAIDDAAIDDFILAYISPLSARMTSVDPSNSPPLSNLLSTFPTPVSSLVTGQKDSEKRWHLDNNFGRAGLPRSPDFFSEPITDLESSCFSHFVHLTGPSFASYFDSTLWEAYACNLALSHPVLFACAAALGCVHRRLNYGISREAFEYCSHAARLHAKAKRMLDELKSQNVNQRLLPGLGPDRTNIHNTTNSSGGWSFGVHDRDVIMASEGLLGLFEGFQTNYDVAVEHMNNTIKLLLDQPMTLLHRETSTCDLGRTPETFARFFAQGRAHIAELLGSPVNILTTWSSDKPLPPMPKVFANLSEAADFVFTEVEWIVHTPASVWHDPIRRKKVQDTHVGRMFIWGVAYAETNRLKARSDIQKKACTLLKWTRSALFTLLYLIFQVQEDAEKDLETNDPKFPDQDIQEVMEDIGNRIRSQNTDDSMNNTSRSYAFTDECLWRTISRRERLLANIRRLTVFGDAIFNPESAFSYIEHSMSFDSAIGPPKCSIRVPESSNKTRHLIKDFLSRPIEEFEWYNFAIYGVAERLSALEEHAVIAAIKGVIPEHVDPKWVDITCLMESRKVLLRYCHPGSDGGEMVWSQEWWAF